MKAIQPFLRGHRFFALLLGLLALQAASSHGQVTFQQITNGLVDYYPLTTINPDGVTTPDLVSRRDMTLVNMNSNNIVSDSHPGIESNYVFNFTQSGGPTIMFYQSTGQNPLDGSGDFFPFINQRGATMNFWIKGPVPANQDLRVFAEGTDNGDFNPFFSLSDQPSSKKGLGLFLRLNSPTTDPNGVINNQFADGTYQLPAYYYEWESYSQYTTSNLFDNNWHMFTMEIATNGDVHVFVDGNYDPGTPADDIRTNLDNEGNQAITPPLDVTNTYYTTNLYPYPAGEPYAGSTPASNPPPNGYVRWMVPGLNQAGAFTAFGGWDRNGGLGAGPVMRLSDIAFWNRVLSTNEIQFVMTNGVLEPGCPLTCGLPCERHVTNFSANPSVIHSGESVTLQWSLLGGASIVSLLLSPTVGEVTNVTDYHTGNGSTNLPVFTNTTFSLSLSYLNLCGFPVQQPTVFTTVTVVPLVFTVTSYLPSDPGNAGNPSFTVTWNSVSNHTYTVQRKFNLTDPAWTTLTSGLPSGGNSTSFTDYTLESSSTAFYRVTWP
jgi:hypothetical protein